MVLVVLEVVLEVLEVVLMFYCAIVLLAGPRAQGSFYMDFQGFVGFPIVS